MGGARASLERYFNRLWYGERLPAAGWRAMSRIYGVVTARRGPPAQQPAVPVIVVGNITVGGGGKTPVVAALAELLKESGFRPAIISRGYGGRMAGNAQRVTGNSDPTLSGDEPVLLALATGCPVWVCRKRCVALDAALEEGADVVISDDGLQHRSLPRSFEICVIDGARGLGNARLLPAGPLREPLTRLESVDLVLVKGAATAATCKTSSGMAFELVGDELVALDGQRKISAQALAGREVDAVCGIANPDSFFTTLEGLGLSIRRHAFPDHHGYTSNDLARLPGPLVVTEKDAVKLERLNGLPETWVLPVRARLPETASAAVLAHVRKFEHP